MKLVLLHYGGVDSEAGVAVWGGRVIVKLVLLFGGVVVGLDSEAGGAVWGGG